MKKVLLICSLLLICSVFLASRPLPSLEARVALVDVSSNYTLKYVYFDLPWISSNRPYEIPRFTATISLWSNDTFIGSTTGVYSYVTTVDNNPSRWFYKILNENRK